MLLRPGVQCVKAQNAARAITSNFGPEGPKPPALKTEFPALDARRERQAHRRFAVDPNLHNLAGQAVCRKTRQRLGVRLSPAAFRRIANLHD
jgi:hypothetical protein